MTSPVRTGTVLAGFRLGPLVGEGAMGAVYLAEDTRTGHRAALKVLQPELARDERFRRRFLRESSLAMQVDHPHIVPTLAAGEDDDVVYLAMAYVEGSDLRELLRREGRLEPERAVELIGEAAGALDAAHAVGLVHRDVKPGNILVSAGPEGEHAYVCDFGLARHVSSVSSLTGERGFVGTIDYVSPEQIEGGTIDARTDVYALGCVLYECLAGERPFGGESELTVVFAHLNETPPRLTDVRPELPAAFDEVFATALAKSPDDRYSSCGELAAAARAALRGEVVARRRPRRRLLAASLVAAAVATAVAVTAILLPGDGLETRVTITPTSILGARLGDSNHLLEQLWDGGQKLAMQTPGDYSVLTQRARNVSAYFAGTTDKAVEITTWNTADRTAEGIGPCSSVDDLKRVYGKRLKASPNNTHEGVVYGWIVGKHLFFAMGPVAHPDHVQTVAVYSNDLPSAGFIASNDGPCAQAAVSTPVRRPVTAPAASTLALTRTLASHAFRPRTTVRAPAGWRVRSDAGHSFVVAAPDGTSLEFRLDPVAADAAGKPRPSVSTTPSALAEWLRSAARSLRAGAPQTLLVGRQVFTATYVDLGPATGAAAVAMPLAFAGSQLVVRRGRHVRAYLTRIRIDTLAHTLAIVVDSPRTVQPSVEAVVNTLQVAAAPAGSLSALSSLCTPVYRGTCLGELTAGTHRTTTFRPALTYTVPAGWTNSGDKIGYVGLIPPGGDYKAVDIGKSDYLNVFTSIATAREGCADGPSSIHTPSGFARWLEHEPGLVTTKPVPVTVGGLSGVVVDIRMRKDWKKTCPWSQGTPAAQVLTGLDPSPDQLAHSMLPQPMVMRLYLLAYRGGTLGIEIDEVRGSSKLAAYSAVVETFRFAG